MTESPRPAAETIPRYQRVWLAVLGTGLVALLSVAVWLRPEPSGIGTHQQLGLPPCSFRVLFGVPCPTCGMSTSWACLVRGRLVAACRANVGGTLLGLLALAGVPWSLAAAVRGRWTAWRPNGNVAAGVLSAITLIALLQWVMRLYAG